MEDEKENPKPKQPWYTRTGVIVMILLSLGPLGLPLVWINPRWNIYVKVIVTIVFCLLSWWLWQWSIQFLKQMHQDLSRLGVSM